MQQVVAGAPSPSDEAAFTQDPKGFCSARASKYGPTFATGAFGGAIFIGDTDALSATVVQSVGPVPGQESALLAPPFEQLPSSEGDPFDTYAAAFNAVCYTTIFDWIPKFKEAGFSTFRFEDFIDARVRKLRPSVRSLLFRATAPAVFGVELDALPGALGYESPKALEKAFAAYAQRLSASQGGGFALSGLLSSLGRGGGDASAFEASVAQWAVRSGKSSDLIWHLASSVEQTGALACNLVAAASAHPGAAEPSKAEQAVILKGLPPQEPITPSLLRQMPALDAFVRETMRVYPPCRPARFELTSDVQWSQADAQAVKLPAGSIVAPEPFTAHFTNAYAKAHTFDPLRYEAGPGPPLMPFATAGEALGADGEDRAAGERLAVSMAKVIYVQLARMFDEVKLGASPPPVPAGYPIYTISEQVEALFKPKMYYELQRGVKKLRF